MERYFLKYSYIGTLYRGVQKQRNSYVRDVDTIQGALESALLTLSPKSCITPAVFSSSRTDAGVHALCATAHVDLKHPGGGLYDPEAAIKTVNRYLIKCGHDIRLLYIIPVKSDFHARYNAKSRSYIYRFMVPKNDERHKYPITEMNRTYLLRENHFDVEKVKHAIQLFLGKKDFTTFAARKVSKQPIFFVRSLNSLTIEETHPLMPFDPLSQNFNFWQISCNSRAFLYKQVRRIVSALLGLGTDVITEKDIITMLQVPGHNNWDTRLYIVPPSGLYLTNVEYDLDELNTYIIK